jgi:hypothetical protein
MSLALEQVARGRVLHRRPHDHRLAVSRPVMFFHCWKLREQR